MPNRSNPVHSVCGQAVASPVCHTGFIVEGSSGSFSLKSGRGTKIFHCIQTTTLVLKTVRTALPQPTHSRPTLSHPQYSLSLIPATILSPSPPTILSFSPSPPTIISLPYPTHITLSHLSHITELSLSLVHTLTHFKVVSAFLCVVTSIF